MFQLFSRPFFRPVLQYGGVLLLPIISLCLKLFFSQLAIPISSDLLFFPSIALSAWNGGYIAGLISSILCGILMQYPFFIPHAKNALPAELFQSLLFIFEGIAISSLIQLATSKKTLFEYKKREKELGEIIETIKNEKKVLEKEIKSRDEFLSIASHELKTPLTSILFQTQYALHNIRNVSLAHFSIESLLKMLESVENQIRRLSKMINDLLNISLMTTGNFQLEYDDVDLHTVIENILTEFDPRLKRGKYEVVYTKTKEIIGKWDKVRIEQAISNLVSNAIKYGNGNPIEITVEKYHEKVHIYVEDSGIGIPKATQKKIFELFERGVSTEDFKGLGVGLYITQQIILAHGGEISVSSKVNKKTTFLITLPLSPK